MLLEVTSTDGGAISIASRLSTRRQRRPIRTGEVAPGGTTWTAAWVPANFQLPALAGSPSRIMVGTFGGSGHADGDTQVFDDHLKPLTRIDRCYRGLLAMAIPAEGRAIAVGTPVSVGFFPPPTNPMYLKHSCRALFSADAGVTWQPATGSEGPGYLRGLVALGPKVALAVGDQGRIYRSEDAGESWKSVDSPTKENLFDVSWDGDNTLLAVGAKGTLLASHDQGKSWQTVPSERQDTLWSVSAAGKFFYALGGPGVALRIKLD